MKNRIFCILALLIFSLFSFSCAIMGFAGQVTSLVGTITDNPLLEAAGSSVAAVSEASSPITPSQEYYIGRSVAAQILGTYDLYENETMTDYVNKVCQVLVINSNRSEVYNGYHVAILDTTQINAFATSGGHILVTRGLLECATSEDALAAVLAHEIAHVQLEHGISSIKSSRWTNAATTLAGATLTALSDGEIDDVMESFGETVNSMVSTMVETGYSKSQEYDADEVALEILNEAGYNPYAMISMLEVLEEKQPNSSGGFASTHPSAKSRLKKVKKALRDYDEVKIPEIRIERFNAKMNIVTE